MPGVQRLLITGVDGFVGHHVAAAAACRGLTVYGIGRADGLPAGTAEHVEDYYSADLTRGVPEFPEVDAVIHLAALAAVGPSFDRPQDYIGGNTAMVTNLAERLLRRRRPVTLLAVSSGAVYGDSHGRPQDESTPVAVTSPYVVSKLAVELQMAYYRNRGLAAVIARPFNHIGPGQRPGFLVPDLYQRLSVLAPGQPLTVGNLNTRRDYLDVRDVADAYIALVTSETHAHTVYNVCSGESLSGHEVLAMICRAMDRPIPELRVDPTRIRPTDTPQVTGSFAALRDEFGWKPRISPAQSIQDFVTRQCANS